MKRFVRISGLVAIAIGLMTSPGWANSTTVSGGTSTSAYNASGTTNTLTITSTGTLNVSGSTAAATLNGNNPSTVQITNNGVLEQTGSAQAIVDAGGHQTITITNGSSTNSSALIETSNGDTIHLDHATNNVTLYNYGSIISQNSSAGGNQAIDWNGITDGATAGEGANTLYNYSTGTITATSADAVRPGIDGTVYNSGEIAVVSTGTGTSDDGIDAQTNTGITINNADAAVTGAGGANLISGARHGIAGGNTGTNTSTPTYMDTANPTDPGVFAMTITNGLGGTIQGNDGSGVNIDGFGYINSSGQSVTNELVTITNSGTITGKGQSRDGDGVDVDGAVILNNTGTIISYNAVPEAGSPAGSIQFSEGVTVGGGTIVNGVGASIIGEQTLNPSEGVGRGITLAGADKGADDSAIPIQSVYEYTNPSTGSLVMPSITNSGLIQGTTESGIAVLGTTNSDLTVTITNNSTGTIEGNNTGISETGTINGASDGQSKNIGAIELDDTSNTYVINNYGTIEQQNLSGGTAVQMNGASNSLNVYGGSASIVGNVTGNTAATSTLTINPGTGNSFSYGYNISNFTVRVNSDGTSGTVTLSGSNNYSGNTTISGGTLYVNNSSGSGAGTGTVTVTGSATLAGSGTIIPAGTSAVVLNSSAILAPGAANIANSNLTINTANFTPGTNPTPNTVLSITTANLTFALSSGSGSTAANQIDIAGGVANTVNFSGTSTATINVVNLGLTLGQEDVLIAGDDTTFAGLNPGSLTNLGAPITTGLVLNSAFLAAHPGSGLYVNGDNVDVFVAPEPSTWVLLLGGVGAIALVLRRRRMSLD